jgi:hypothetical protein
LEGLKKSREPEWIKSRGTERRCRFNAPVTRIRLNASLPITITPGGVEHGGDDYCVLVFQHFIDHPVWKSLWIAPANISDWMLSGAKQRIYCQSIEYRKDILNEFRPKTFAIGFIPRSRFVLDHRQRPVVARRANSFR